MRDNVSGAEQIMLERHRQIESERYTDEHDDEHINDELALAACCYASPTNLYQKINKDNGEIHFVDPWPFDSCEDNRGDKSRITLLVMAGALIAAEIDRLVRRTNEQTHKA